MNWKEVVVEVAFDVTNAFSDALMNAGALSITVEDADLGTPAEQPLFDEPGADSNEYAWKRSRIIALLPADAFVKDVLQKATKECELAEVPEFILREVPDEDWVRVTQPNSTRFTSARKSGLCQAGTIFRIKAGSFSNWTLALHSAQGLTRQPGCALNGSK